MKNIIILMVVFIGLVSCDSQRDPNRFKSGLFIIPEGNGYKETLIERIDSIQIETYNNKVDTLLISWQSNFKYTLKMLHPKTEIDKEPIYVRITNIHDNSYDFEAVIGHSNFKQTGTLLIK